MIHFLKYYIIIFCFLLVVENTNAQEKYQAVSWNFKQGLANGTAFCTIKDKIGFLWIGTQQGLSRFDGNIFKNYFPDAKDPRAIKGEFILGLIEDSLHNIWIGTDKGLTRHDLLADSFTNFLPVLDKTVSNKSVVPFWATKDELFCLESDSIISTTNINTLERKIAVSLNRQHHPKYKISARNSIFDEASRTFWMLANNNKGGLLEISMAGKNEVHHTWSCYKNIPDHNHGSEGMCLDVKRKCIWINTEDGFIQFTLANKQFNEVDPMKDSHTRGSSISIDRQDRIWVGTGRYKELMLIYTPETKLVSFPVWGDSSIQYMANSTNSSIYFDKDNIAWITYWSQGSEGITQLIPYSPSAFRYANKTISSWLGFANSIREMADKHLLIAAENGLYSMDPETGVYSTIGSNDIKNVRLKQPITFYGVDTKGEKAWFVINPTKESFELDLKTRYCTPLLFTDTANRKMVQPGSFQGPAIPFQQGILVPGQSENRQNQCVYYIGENSPVVHQVIALSTEKILKLQLINEGLLFFTFEGTKKHLTFLFENGKWIQRPHTADSIETDNLMYNPSDSGWWGSIGNELMRYDRYFNITDTFSASDGIPYDGNINGIQIDENGNIWFNTHKLVSQLNIKTKKIFTLGEKDGFPAQRYYPDFPIVKVESGDLYILGGYEGLDRIKPDRLRLTYPASSVYLKSLSINQSPFAESAGLQTLDRLTLSYKQNRIDIETGIIDYYSKGSSRIRYKLEGKMADWQYGPANHTIRYEDLHSGISRLLIQASNAAGEYNGPLKILELKIIPPWWETWWFRILTIAALIAMIYSIIQFRSAKLKQRNTVLEEKVMHRTKELKHSLEELRATQSQLIMREKMASLGELTAGIAHEIQNPLNFVNNFSEVSREMLEELQSERLKKKGEKDEELENEILSDVTQNLEKVIHYGKRADGIVKGMLQHSRSNTGEMEPTDINALADEYLRLAFHGLRGKDNSFKVTMKTDFDESIGKISIIPQEIGRVLLNVYNNAFYAVHAKSSAIASAYAEATADKSAKDEALATVSAVDEQKKKAGETYEPTVSVSTKLIATSSLGQSDMTSLRRSDQKEETSAELREGAAGKYANSLIISVMDNGGGIPEKVVDKIFQPFFTTKPTGQGTGLGLSLSYDIIRAHGGDIKVKTVVGEGSEFIITLPKVAMS